MKFVYLPETAGQSLGLANDVGHACFPRLARPLQLVSGLKACVLDQVQVQIAVSRTQVWYVPFVGDFEDECQTAEDSCHPSALGVSIWAKELSKIIIENRQEK